MGWFSKKQDCICWYSDEASLEKMKKNNAKKNEYNYIYKHVSEHVPGAFGGAHSPTSSSSSENCNHEWVRVKHDGGTKLECKKCFKRDHDSWRP